MAPRPPPKLAVTLPNDSTLQWHRTMAPQQWHHVHSPKVTRHLPPPTMAHYNGTLQWHPGATSNLPKWFVALPPIGSKNPYNYLYLGKKLTKHLDVDPHFITGHRLFIQYNICFHAPMHISAVLCAYQNLELLRNSAKVSIPSA